MGLSQSGSSGTVTVRELWDCDCQGAVGTVTIRELWDCNNQGALGL